MSKSKKLFFLLSLTIAIIDGLFVSTNFFYSKNSFRATLQEDNNNYYAIYNTILESTYNGLSMQATLYAGDKRIQELFLQGKKALAQEGGGAGGVKTAKIRQELYHLVAKAWQDATKKFDVRHFHFHLGPGSLSFLRVHKPDKFGDRLDELRFIVVDTNADQIPRNGFETGRASSGLRSVTPVFAWDPELKQKVYVGALEVSTSYKNLLQSIDNNLNIELSILLNKQHIKNTVWDEFISGIYSSQSLKNCDCIMEANSRPAQEPILEHLTNELTIEEQLIKADKQVKIVNYNQRYYAVAFYPLRDYLGHKEPSRNNIGAVFISKDITESIGSYQEEQLFNFIYGILAYIIIELLLVLTFYKVTRHLTYQVHKQTAELSKQKKLIELDKAKYKNLVDAINTHYFFYKRNNKKQFFYVSSSVYQVLGFTVEEFIGNKVHFLSDNSKHISLENNNSTFEVSILNKNRRLQYLLVTETQAFKQNTHKLAHIEGLAQDITQSRQDTMLLKLRCNVLQMISDNQVQKKILETLTLGVENIIQDINCVIMLVNQEKQQIEIGCAPNLPYAFKSAICGVDISSEIASFGIAVATGKRKIIQDMYLDPSYKTFQAELENSDYKSCWSEPVLSSNAKVIATVDIYYHDKQTPSTSDLSIITTVVDLVYSLLSRKY